jgi:hypothetical protein
MYLEVKNKETKYQLYLCHIKRLIGNWGLLNIIGVSEGIASASKPVLIKLIKTKLEYLIH